VASWRGLGLKFTDGICPRCLEQFREEHRRFLERRTHLAQVTTSGHAA